MKKQTDKIIQAIENHQKIILLRHINPDGDAYGVQLGLKELIRYHWPEKMVKAAGESSEYLAFIGTMDEVSDEDFKDSLVIIGDCGNLARVDDQRFSLAKTIIKVDHHPNVEPYGDLEALWVDTSFVSASEMIAFWAQKNQLTITKEAARVIFHGMVTDSGRFLFPRTNVRTFTLASFLLKTGFDLDKLYRQMYQTTETDLKFVSYVYEKYKTTSGVIYLRLDAATLKKLNLSSVVAATKVNLLSNVKDKPIWLFFCERDDETIRVEFRSNRYAVNQVAMKFNGGGHKFAAGAILKSWNEVDHVLASCVELMRQEQ